MVKAIASLILSVMIAGLIAMFTVVWDSKVSRADYNILKNSVQKDIALIKKDISYIREDAEEIKEILIRKSR